jgi:hypothetical protein
MKLKILKLFIVLFGILVGVEGVFAGFPFVFRVVVAFILLQILQHSLLVSRVGFPISIHIAIVQIILEADPFRVDRVHKSILFVIRRQILADLAVVHRLTHLTFTDAVVRHFVFVWVVVAPVVLVIRVL